MPTECPCGSGDGFSRCCQPLHLGERQAETAEELMRSRYCAYAVDAFDYLWATWHPRTRPDQPVSGEGIEWMGLEIRDVVDGRPGDDTGEVEFVAYYSETAGDRQNQRRGTLHERSRFAVRARRWFYVDGDVFD